MGLVELIHKFVILLKDFCTYDSILDLNIISFIVGAKKKVVLLKPIWHLIVGFPKYWILLRNQELFLLIVYLVVVSDIYMNIKFI